MAKELTYNLPGYGFTHCNMFGQTIDLMNLLETVGIIEKMQSTCQLGTMKYVYPGAHHTRYEYVFTQLMLISNITESKKHHNVELSLSSNLGEYKSLGYTISGSTLMQCLAILSNIGHMYDTFTSAKILLRLLKESKRDKTSFYDVYKRNLPKTIRKKFDECLLTGNYYKLHLFHALHILQGMARSDKHKQLCDLCTQILSGLIDSSLVKNESTQRIFFLYKKIRKIAYLSVDMVYTPASFGANLNRMVYSIPTYVDDLFDENSAMNKSIQQLEDIIHQQIYDSAMCILNSARIEQESYNKYKEKTEIINSASLLRGLLLEKDDFGRLHSQFQPKAIHELKKDTTLLLSKTRKLGSDYDFERENQIMANLPMSRVACGIQPAQNMRKTYLSYGLINIAHIQKDVHSILSNVIEAKLFDSTNKIELVKYAIKSLYKYGEFFFNVTAPSNIPVNNCVFVGRGCKKVSNEIRSYFTKDKVPAINQLHEILSCASALESLNYSGNIICFVGGIKASKYSKSSQIDELDGFIYFPNRSMKDGFAYIVEAKNYFGGEKDAEAQLQNTCDFLDSSLKTNIVKLSKCAYLKIAQN